MQAVILAGGLGTRLYPFTKIIPKPLLPVGEKSVLEIQIELLKRFEINEIIFATNYKHELLESYFGDGSRYGIRLTYSREENPLGTCGPLSLLKEKLKNTFIVINGDILTDMAFSAAYNEHLKKNAILTVVSKEVVFPLSYGKLVSSGDMIVDIQEKPDIKVEIATGIYIMSTQVLKYIPYNVYFNMDQLVQRLLDENIPVFRYKTDAYWLDIGRMEDYEKAQRLFGEKSTI